MHVRTKFGDRAHAQFHEIFGNIADDENREIAINNWESDLIAVHETVGFDRPCIAVSKVSEQAWVVVTSRKVVWLFLEQLRLDFVPALHRLQGRPAAQG